MMANQYPLVTIIIPIRNEAAYIEHSIRAILEQDYPGEVEILVADGMSTDRTRDIVGQLATMDSRIRLVDNPAQIMATGFNTALSISKGDAVVVVGGHTELSSNYISRCVAYLSKYKVDCVGGFTETVAPTLKGQTIAVAMSSTFGVGGVAFRTQPARSKFVDTVAFGVYRREIVDRAGPFDEELVRNQDDEYNYRIQKLGGKILMAHDVKSTYFCRTSLMGLWKQYFQYGYWKVRVLQKHPRQMSLRQFVPPVFSLALLCTASVSFLPNLRPLFPGLLLTYLFANLSASVITASKRGWKYLQLLPLTYAILHLSYGMGFLTGLIKFVNRWNEKG